MQSFSSIKGGADQDRMQDRIVKRLPRDLRFSLLTSGVVIAVATGISALFETDFLRTIGSPQFVGITAYFFQAQDASCLAFIALLLIAFAVVPWPLWLSRPNACIARRPFIAALGMAIIVLVLGIVGTHLIFGGYQLARDEFLADYDAIIFRAGKVIAPIDPAWQPFSLALAPRFMLPVAQGAGFVSAYLPVNAALRAAVGLFGDRNWTSPLLAAVSILATYGIGRRLWPSRPDATLISVLLLATSSQMLVTAMTSYAMTAHLALNLIWLWLFLRNERVGHAGAIATGFLACGLHQLIFHPLFAAPFILRLWQSGRRPLALVYIVSYAVICLFWIFYWKIVLQAAGMAPALAENVGSTYFVATVLVLLANFDFAGADLMLKNLLRFIAWQGPALLPLAVLAYPALKRGDGIARELLAGLLLTIVAVFILLPYQGHGWGYRYIHGFLGSAALLGGYGWIALSDRLRPDELATTRIFILASSLIACLVLLPIHAIEAHDFVLPYRKALQAIVQTPADVVIVDETRMLFGEDLVRNDPFLRNRPKILDLAYLSEANIAELCAHDRIALFDAAQARALGILPNDKKKIAPRQIELRALLNRSCATEPVLKISGTQH